MNKHQVLGLWILYVCVCVCGCIKLNLFIKQWNVYIVYQSIDVFDFNNDN